MPLCLDLGTKRALFLYSSYASSGVWLNRGLESVFCHSLYVWVYIKAEACLPAPTPLVCNCYDCNAWLAENACGAGAANELSVC